MIRKPRLAQTPFPKPCCSRWRRILETADKKELWAGGLIKCVGSAFRLRDRGNNEP